MVKTFVPAKQLQVGQLVWVFPRLAEYVGLPHLVGTCSPVTSIVVHDGGRNIGVTLAAIGREVCSLADVRLEVLDVEAERTLAEVEAMTAEALGAHLLATLATRGPSAYSALVAGQLASVTDCDEDALVARYQAAADRMVSL